MLVHCLSDMNAAIRPGDLVEVKAPEEILSTLDADGTLDHVPFMPEMVEFCGKRVKVSKWVATVCQGPRGFRADDVFFLDGLRCSRATQAIEKEDVVGPETPGALADCRNPLGHLDSFPTELDHFRHERHVIQRSVRVQCRKNLLRCLHFYEVAGANGRIHVRQAMDQHRQRAAIQKCRSGDRSC